MAKKSATTTVQSTKGTKAAQASTQTPVRTRKAEKVAPATEAPKAEATEKKASKYRGVTTGMRVMEYQDHSLAINDQKDRRFTEDELRADWQREFPNAVQFTEAHVRGVRSLYNAGKHRKESVVPATPSVPYAIVDGKRVQVAYTRAKKASAPVTEPVAATPVLKVRKAKAGKLAKAS